MFDSFENDLVPSRNQEITLTSDILDSLSKDSTCANQWSKEKTTSHQEDLNDIPSWQRDIEKKKEEEAKRKAEQERKEREAKEAKERESQEQEAKKVQEAYKLAIDKAVKSGDIPAVVIKELEKTPCPRGLRELVDKIAEGYGAKATKSSLDQSVYHDKGSPRIYGSEYWVRAEGADAKLAKMTPKEASKALSDWVKEGKNPYEPGGALEQRMVKVYYRHEIVGIGVGRGQLLEMRDDLGVYNPRKPVQDQIDEYYKKTKPQFVPPTEGSALEDLIDRLKKYGIKDNSLR
jgi:hypothetical protein